MGRPKKQIDPDLVFKLSMIGCSARAIADHLHCAHTVLTRRFSEELARGKAQGEINVVARLYQSACKGNVKSMELFLVNRAGWSRKPEVQVTTNVVQNNAPALDPEKVKAHLLMLQKHIMAQAKAELEAEQALDRA